jgi:hypothetical protein
VFKRQPHTFVAEVHLPQPARLRQASIGSFHSKPYIIGHSLMPVLCSACLWRMVSAESIRTFFKASVADLATAAGGAHEQEGR